MATDPVAERARLAREERLATAYRARGQAGAAERFNPALARSAALAPRPALLDPSVLGSNDRTLIAAQLRAQGEYARQALAAERAKDRRDQDKDRLERYEDMARYSDREAAAVLGGSGALSSQERVNIGRSRDPEAKTTELRAKYATGRQREKAINALQDRAAAEKQKEKEGFTGTTGQFIDEQQAKAKAAQQEARVERRERFAASGRSLQASDAEVQAAQVNQIRKGNLTVLNATTGQPFAIQGNTLVQVREPTPKPTTFRQPLASEAVPSGRSLYVPSVSSGSFVTSSNVATLTSDAPTKTGEIQFSRTPTPQGAKEEASAIIERVNPFSTTPQRPKTEVSRKSEIFTQTVVVPDEETAKVIGYPSAGTYNVVTETRTDYPRKTFMQREFPKVTAAREKTAAAFALADQNAVALGQIADKPRSERTTRESVLLPAARVVRGVQELGASTERVGSGVATVGERLEASRFVQVSEAAPFVGALPVRPSSAAKTVTVVGGAIQETGRAVKERPLTAGTGEAVLIGTGFGAVNRTIKAVKASRYAKRATTGAKLVRGTAKVAGVVETGAAVGLGADFVVTTGVKAALAPTTRDAGAVIGESGLQAVGFGVGFRAGSAAVGGAVQATREVRSAVTVAKLNRKFQGQLITRDTVTDIARTSRELSLDIKGRPIERDVYEYRETASGGVAVRQVQGERVLGAEQMVRAQDILDPNQPFLARATIETATATGPASGRSSSQLSQPGTLVVERGEQTALVSGRQIMQTEPLGADVTVRRVEATDLAPGVQRVVAGRASVTYEPIALSSETTLARTGKDTTPSTDVKQLGYEPKQLTANEPAPQLEKVTRFQEEPGPTTTMIETPTAVGFQRGRAELAVRKDTGGFVVKEFTEFRKFQYGVRGIPGRPVLSTGQLTPEAVASLSRPVVITKITRAKEPTKRGAVTTVEGSPTEVATSGGQVLLQQRVARVEPVQEQQAVTVQEMAPLEQVQEQVQEQTVRQEQATLGDVLVLRRRRVSSELARARSESIGATAQESSLSFRFAPALDTATSSVQNFAQRSRVEQSTSQATRQDIAAVQALDVAQAQATSSATAQARIQTPTFETPQRSEFPFARPVEIQKPIPRRARQDNDETTMESKQFQVEVRRGGKFVPVSFQGLRLVDAVRLGESIVDTTAARSFRVVQAGQPVTGPDRRQVSQAVSPTKYRLAKNDPSVFVEKSRFAINTPGEKFEIRPKSPFSTKNTSPFRRM